MRARLLVVNAVCDTGSNVSKQTTPLQRTSKGRGKASPAVPTVNTVLRGESHHTSSQITVYAPCSVTWDWCIQGSQLKGLLWTEILRSVWDLRCCSETLKLNGETPWLLTDQISPRAPPPNILLSPRWTGKSQSHRRGTDFGSQTQTGEPWWLAHTIPNHIGNMRNTPA